MPEVTYDDLDLSGLYRSYAAAASEGDLDAIYVQTKLLERCRNTDNAALPESVEYSNLTDDEKDSELARYESCQSIVADVADLQSKIDEFYDRLRTAQHPLLMVMRRELSAEQKKVLLGLALMADYPEPFMYERAFMEASWYHHQYPEHANKLRQEAWTLLYCEASLSCDSNDYRATVTASVYHEHEYKEIIEIESSLRHALQEKTFDSLGF